MGRLRTKPQLRQGRADERFIKHHVRAAGASRDQVKQARQPASPAAPFPPPGAKSAAAFWPNLLPRYSPCYCSPVSPKEGKKEKPGFMAFRGSLTWSSFCGTPGQGGVGSTPGSCYCGVAVLSLFPHLWRRPLIATDNQGYYLFFLA